jgi:sugar-phosphatase
MSALPFPSDPVLTRSTLPDRAFAAFLFDMDGTLLSSIACAERVWARWARRHGVDVASFLPTIHGKRAVDTVGQLGLAGVDAAAEAALIQAEEMVDVEGIEQIAGVAAFVGALPADRWAVVTSAPRELARRRIAAAGLPVPPLMIAAEDVINGKPAPDCFELAASRLGVSTRDCLVFEDAPAGIAAAEAAGASVLVITATHAHPLDTRHRVVGDYAGFAPQVDADGALRLVPLAG